MSLNDTSIVRSAAELERKYNLSKLAGLSANVETNSTELINIQNELTNMLNTLIINLGDVLDDNISLWFYPGIPTTSNLPYTSWLTPSDHIGDIYYDQNSGYVYKYTSNGWVQNTDTNLISAMALTNAELDVSTDHERKVYISQPIPPYDSGDWWILEDGTLKICQLGKQSGDYDVNDFVVSSKYTTTVATKQNDTITVLKGTVTEITEDYVKYTDLSTGGSTTIAGENITTGNIKSSNYVSGTSGTNINLTNGVISTPNAIIDSEGLKLANGAKVVGSNGLMNTYLFDDKVTIGYTYNYGSGEVSAINNVLSFYIPEGLQITSAKLKIIHTPILWKLWDINGNVSFGWGGAKNVKLYRINNVVNEFIWAIPNSGSSGGEDLTDITEIPSAFGDPNGYTATIPTSTTDTPLIHSTPTTEIVTSVELKNYITNTNNNGNYFGLKQIALKLPDPSTFCDPTQEDEPTIINKISNRTGKATLLLEIEGYMTYS